MNNEVHADTAGKANIGNEEVSNYYQKVYVPKVHRIGRSTIIAFLILVFLPVIYLCFIKGYRLPLSTYINLALTEAGMMIGMWIAEPFMFYPMMGAACIYMGYTAGNNVPMRLPVALSVQGTFGADVNSPKGQIASVIAVGVSIFVNLFIIFAIVLGGNLLISVLPQAVVNSFNYVFPSLMGAMAAMSIVPKKTEGIPYCIVGLVFYLGGAFLFPALAGYGIILSVVISILLAYVLYKRKDTSGQEE